MIGGAIIDSLIPAVFSAILVLGVNLYNISLFALLLPFCVIIGIICYIRFIYHPALAAHSRRERALGQIRREATISSNTSRHRHKASMMSTKGPRYSPQSLFDYIQRVSNIAKHAVQYAVSNFSDQRLKARAARRAANERAWCHMNMPSSSQGIVLVTGGRELRRRKRTFDDVRRRSRRGMFSLKKSNYFPPVEIANMMIAGSNMKIFHLDQQGTLENPLENPIAGDTLGTDEFIIRVPAKNGLSLRELKSVILFDVRDALLRMRSQLSVVTSRPLENTDHFDISESDLCSVFQNIFEAFYPDGISMSAMEITEAEEFFSEWMDAQNSHFEVESDGSAFSFKRMISFHLFEKWFAEDLMGVIHNTVIERLLAHTFKIPPIVRTKKTNETSPHPFDTAASCNSLDEGHLNMKALKMVTASSLLVIRPAGGTRENSATLTLPPLNMSTKSDVSTIFLSSEQVPEVSVPISDTPQDIPAGCFGDIFYTASL